MKVLFKLSAFISALITFVIEGGLAMTIVCIVARILSIPASPYLWIAALILYLLYDKYVTVHDSMIEAAMLEEIMEKAKGKLNEDESDGD